MNRLKYPPKRAIGFPVVAIHGTTSQFNARRRDGTFSEARAAEARAMGINPTGKSFSPQLNQWIDGPDDVKRICRANGYGCEGSVNVDFNPPDEPDKGPYRVADDLVEQEVDERLMDEGVTELPGREYDDLTEKVREEITPVVGVD